MSRALVCLVAVLSLTSADAALAQARPTQLAPDPSRPARDNAVQTGTALIKGRVVEAANGQPVRKARVHAGSTALRDGRTAYTDADGRYELKAMPPGHYTVTAFKPAYVSAAF